MSHPQPYGYPVQPVQTQVLVQPYRCSTAHVVVAWVVTVLTAFYMLPWAVAATRNRRNVLAVAMINLFLGWSVIGWIVALVMACGSDQPVVTVHHTYGPPQQPWGPAPQQPWLQAPPQQPWVQAPPQQQPYAEQPYAPPAALPARPYAPYAAEATQVDPFGSEPTQELPRSPWEPDHRR